MDSLLLISLLAGRQARIPCAITQEECANYFRTTGTHYLRTTGTHYLDLVEAASDAAMVCHL
jgi:hypothetical protein